MTDSPRTTEIQAAIEAGPEAFLRRNAGTTGLTDVAIIDWNVTWEPSGNCLTAYGNVKPADPTQSVTLLVVAFTSPDYQPGGGGTYYGGSLWGAIGNPPPGFGCGFVLQSQQFIGTGQVVQVAVQGWVDLTLFTFTQDITLT